MGIGPGSPEHMTLAAYKALQAAHVIVGYRRYIEYAAQAVSLEGKEVLASGMRHEVERVQQALQHAAQGKKVALLSTGDAGIYGMAGLALEYQKELSQTQGHTQAADVLIEVIPGVTAASAAAACLGAPLMNDFVVLSCSDLMTPLEVICKRAEAAFSGDFVVCIYNPISHTRKKTFEAVLAIARRYHKPHTPVGIVRNALRNESSTKITTLSQLSLDDIDMLSLVIIGNSQTFVWDNRLITPRGYKLKAQDNLFKKS